MNWPELPLSTVAVINPSRPRTLKLDDDALVSFVPMPTVSETTASIETVEYRSYEEVKKGFTYFEEKDVLFAKITPCMENGKSALAIGLRNGIGFGSTEFHVLRAKEQFIIPEFLHYYIRQQSFRNAAKSRMRGAVGQQRVPKDFLEDVMLPIPSLSEQKRIVKILDQADELRRMRANADDRAARILPALFYKMFGDPATNPKGWITTPLGEALKIVGGGTPSKGKLEYWNGTIPWVSPKDMKTIYIEDTEDYITEDAIRNSATNKVPEGIPLIVFRSGILAHSLPVAIAARDVALNQDMKALIPKNEDIEPLFTLAWLLASKKMILSCVKRGPTVHSIDGNRFSKLTFILPDHKLQKCFFKNIS